MVSHKITLSELFQRSIEILSRILLGRGQVSVYVVQRIRFSAKLFFNGNCASDTSGRVFFSDCRTLVWSSPRTSQGLLLCLSACIGQEYLPLPPPQPQQADGGPRNVLSGVAVQCNANCCISWPTWGRKGQLLEMLAKHMLLTCWRPI